MKPFIYLAKKLSKNETLSCTAIPVGEDTNRGAQKLEVYFLKRNETIHLPR